MYRGGIVGIQKVKNLFLNKIPVLLCRTSKDNVLCLDGTARKSGGRGGVCKWGIGGFVGTGYVWKCVLPYFLNGDFQIVILSELYSCFCRFFDVLFYELL